MFCPCCGRSLEEGSQFCDRCGAALSEYQKESALFSARKKRTRLTGIFGTIVLVLLLVLIAFGITNLVKGRAEDSSLVVAFCSDGSAVLLTDFSQEDAAVSLPVLTPDGQAENSVVFGPDGDTLYYFTRIDSETDTGTLCKISVSDLTKDDTAPSGLTICRNVRTDLTFLEDGSLLFLTKDQTLHRYDGDEVTDLAADVDEIYTDGFRILYVTSKKEENDHSLYGIDLSRSEEAIPLASHYSGLYLEENDFEHIFYTKNNDAGELSLYSTGFCENPVKIAKNVTVLDGDFAHLCYLAPSDAVSPADFVADALPEESDFLKDQSNDVPLLSLYIVEEGVVTELYDGILSFRCFAGALMFNSVDMITGRVVVSENIDSVKDVTDLFALDPYAANNLFIDTGEPVIVKIPEDLAEDLFYLTGEDSCEIYSAGTSLYLADESEENLYAVILSGDQIDLVLPAVGDAHYLGSLNGTAYYAKFPYGSSHSEETCDLYTIRDGEEVLLAADVYTDSVTVTSDQTILAYTDCLTPYGYELSFFDEDGASFIVADDVAMYACLADSSVLYLRDGCLYRYDGSERTLLGTDVTSFFVSNPMSEEAAFQN